MHKEGFASLNSRGEPYGISEKMAKVDNFREENIEKK
jgi:hypothetical protein